MPKYDDSFEVVQRVREIAYRMKLLQKLSILPIFHVSFLKLYYADEDDSERNKSKRAPASITMKFDGDIYMILDHQVVDTSKKNTRDSYWYIGKPRVLEDAVREKGKDLW